MSDFEYCSQGKEVSKQSPVTYVEVSKTLKKMPQLPLNNFSLLYELKKKNLLEIVVGGLMRAWERQILFWYELLSHHTLRIFSRHLSQTEMTPGPALTSVKPLDQWHLATPPPPPNSALALETRSARGYTYILPATHSLDCVDVHVCVCVCTCPGPLVYPWPPCTVITTHSCHLPLSLSLVHPPPIAGVISTVDPNVSSHD